MVGVFVVFMPVYLRPMHAFIISDSDVFFVKIVIYFFLFCINSFFKFLWPLDITGGGAGTTAFVHY